MRTQLNLLTERISFAEACEPEFHSCPLVVASPASVAVPALADVMQPFGAPLRRWNKSGAYEAALTPPESSADAATRLREAFECALYGQVHDMSPGQLCHLSLNLGVLERVPSYFDHVLDGARLMHPIEYVNRLSNTCLESLTLELRTLNMEYQSALYDEDRLIHVRPAEISRFARKGRDIISREITRTENYYHEAKRIAGALRHYYAFQVVPLDNDARTQPTLRNLCRALTTAMGRLKEGMVIFEHRLRDVSSCNAALKMGVEEPRPLSASASPTTSIVEDTTLDVPLVLPNIMRPSQQLEVTTTKQVRTLKLFFSEYAQIVGKSFTDWAMLHGDIADLVNVIRDPSIREIYWPKPTEPDDTVSGDVLSGIDPLDVEAVSFHEEEEAEMACIRAIAYGLTEDSGDLDQGPSSRPALKPSFLR